MNTEFIESQIEEYGEIHVVVEEHESVMGDEGEDYIGLRNNDTTEILHDDNLIYVDDGSTEHYIDASRVIYFHGANGFPD